MIVDDHLTLVYLPRFCPQPSEAECARMETLRNALLKYEHNRSGLGVADERIRCPQVCANLACWFYGGRLTRYLRILGVHCIIVRAFPGHRISTSARRSPRQSLDRCRRRNVPSSSVWRIAWLMRAVWICKAYVPLVLLPAQRDKPTSIGDVSRSISAARCDRRLRALGVPLPIPPLSPSICADVGTSCALGGNL